MIEIKTDPAYPHHYIFSVTMLGMTSKTPGKMYLKHGPVYYTNDDVVKIQNVLRLSNDKIYKEIYKFKGISELARVMDCKDLLITFMGMEISASANNASLHHFSSEVELEDKNWFVEFVNSANKDKKIRERLMDAKI